MICDLVKNTLCIYRKWQKISPPTLYPIFFKFFFFFGDHNNLVQTSQNVWYIECWCMQVKINLFLIVFLIERYFFCYNRERFECFFELNMSMYAFRVVSCKCANTQKTSTWMYLSFYYWCVCKLIHKTVKFLKHVHVCKTHFYTNCYVSYFMLMCLTFCEYANILLMRGTCTCSLLGFFFLLWYIGCASHIHVINLYHNDKNHDWIKFKKKRKFLEFSKCYHRHFEISYIFMLQFWHFEFGILSHNLLPWVYFCPWAWFL